jgi:rhodanese-related sulfurtransferase
MVGFAASNILRGDVTAITWDQIADLDRTQDVLLDVRNPPEWEGGIIEGALTIPLPRLRERIDEIPTGKRLVVYCHAGQRAYYACRILTQRGWETVNLSGGYQTYSHAVRPQSNFDAFADLAISNTEEISAAPPRDS